MEIKDLIGSWNLLKHGIERPDGTFQSTSDYLKGQLIYSADGSMSVFILKKAKPESFADIVVYSGRYTLETDRILHHIELSPDPARRGTTEARFFRLKNAVLQLTTIPTDSGRFLIEWGDPAPN